MRAYIDVVDENERDLIAQGLCDPATRALVKVIGVLLPLDPVQRLRVIEKVQRKIESQKPGR